MHTFDFLDELVIISAMAILVIVVFQRLRLPAIIGLIATGIILGPSGAGIVVQNDVIATLAELGVILLLFTIGLEFSLNDLRSMRRIVLAGGSLQVLLTSLLSGVLAALGLVAVGVDASVNTLIFIGLTVSVSSTAICAKVLKERRELSLPHGRASMGILLFQDIIIVPLMIVISLLDQNANVTTADIALRIGTFIGFGTAIAVGLRLLLPRLTRFVSLASAQEVLILGALVICFGAAYITSLVGMSMALGAFMAGVITAGTDQGHRIGRAVESMRDAFTSIFFISVGLLLDINPTLLVPTVVGAVAVVIVKALVVTAVLRALGCSIRVAMLAGVVLAQIGEFSFVLAESGLKSGLITNDGFQAMLLVIIVTMTLAPLLISAAPRLVERAVPRSSFAPLSTFSQGASKPLEVMATPNVVIIGYGVHGRNVARVLDATAIPYRVMEMSSQTVEKCRKQGVPIVYGDATDLEDLQLAGLQHANSVIIAISDQSAVAMATTIIRRARPDIFVIARTRYARDVEAISKAGADVVVTEEYESSIQVFIALLQHLGVESDVIVEQESLMHSHRYGVLGRITDAAREQA
ncbi:MAG: sodium:proton exchanger [Candidatus Kapabacteria bacterium]|nr:sodium:proton exchanger [Candidatus Kapabacteria bacterium]